MVKGIPSIFTNIIHGWNEMSLDRKIRRVISIGLIFFGIWALSPYLYSRTINEEAPGLAAGAPLLTGNLVPGSFPGDRAEGQATVVRLPDGALSLRLENFSTTNGPDLFVVLSASDNPDRDGLKANDYRQLDALKGNKGNQNYALPSDIDISRYKSVVIWCRAFNIVFGYGTLRPAV